MTERNMDVLLLRMVPFVENNYNMVELGPRGTGKSHLFQQISPYAHLVSGGKATVARMFVNNANGQRGLVCQYDVVCFDEVSGVSFDQKDGVNIMKGYMESGEFSRGKESIRAYGGIVMVGNFDVDVQHQQRIGHLFGPMPPEMRNDTALMDRIHCYLPGWDVPKISGAAQDRTISAWSATSLASAGAGCGARAGSSALQGRVTFGGALSGRDQNAVNKTISGLLKLIHPSPGRAGSRRRPGMGGAAGPGVPPPGQGAAEANRLGRVPQHAVQLHAGQGRRREVRRHAGIAERRPYRPRSPAARPGLGDQPRRAGRRLRACTGSK